MKYAKFIMVLCVFLVSQFLRAQESYPISGYTPDVYHGESQNWDICQSDKNIIYIANNKGLLEFNGASWKLYPSPNHTIMRSLCAKDNRIYAGCYMEFGYWEKDGFLNMRYVSLSSKIRRQLIQDEQFWKILCYQQWVLFQSQHRIYVYDTLRHTFRKIDTKSILTKLFAVHNQLYFQMINEGIFKIEKGKPMLISNNTIFKTDPIINIFPFGSRLLIETQNKGFFIYDNSAVVEWKVPGASVVNSLSVYCSMQLQDGSFVLGTIGDGIYFLSSTGNITGHINKKGGLQNNTILSLYEDVDRNIWLGLDNGVNVLSYASPYKVFFDVNGTLGSVYATAYYKGNLYLGTNQGLFYRPLYSNANFKFVRGTKGQVWMLKVIDNTLFCGHHSGTFIVEGDAVRQICSNQGTWEIKPVDGHPNLLLQGNYEGLNILEKTSGGWHYRNKIGGFNISSRYFEQMPGGLIFVNHEYKGVYKLKIDVDYRKVTAMEKIKDVPLCHNSAIARYRGNLIYYIESGFYKYNTKAHQFVKDMQWTHRVLGDDDYTSGKMIQGENESLWIFTKDNVSAIFPDKINNESTIYRIAMPFSVRESMFGFENLLSLGNDTYLLGTTNGYIMFDMRKMYDRNYEIQMSAIERNKSRYDQSYVPCPVTDCSLKSWENNIRFSYYVPVYGKYALVKYQYKLEGINKEWNSWTCESDVTFNNLPSGTYTFKVRAKVGNKLTSNVASFTFTIARPWYASIWMKFIYVSLVILLLFVTNRWYKKRYEKREEEINRENLVMKLKSDQEIMTLKQDNLNNEIESINRDLVSTTMAVIKRDELLGSIKLKLQQAAGRTGINEVLKIIDENIEKNGGWELFQDAFDNMDRDFLKKMKELHPLLTPNDLKLCVYLRLNLSSKEIAPMLNISPQSVEIKRFRLRKKIGLNHEENLTDYILSV